MRRGAGHRYLWPAPRLCPSLCLGHGPTSRRRWCGRRLCPRLRCRWSAAHPDHVVAGRPGLAGVGRGEGSAPALRGVGRSRGYRSCLPVERVLNICPSTIWRLPKTVSLGSCHGRVIEVARPPIDSTLPHAWRFFPFPAAAGNGQGCAGQSSLGPDDRIRKARSRQKEYLRQERYVRRTSTGGLARRLDRWFLCASSPLEPSGSPPARQRSASAAGTTRNAWHHDGRQRAR